MAPKVILLVSFAVLVKSGSLGSRIAVVSCLNRQREYVTDTKLHHQMLECLPFAKIKLDLKTYFISASERARSTAISATYETNYNP